MEAPWLAAWCATSGAIESRVSIIDQHVNRPIEIIDQPCSQANGIIVHQTALDNRPPTTVDQDNGFSKFGGAIEAIRQHLGLSVAVEALFAAVKPQHIRL